ncbi:MAG: SIMPL domain-containing protein [Longimicrobiales bacterium]|nr:SIMPL domain-containing protein [Longimicrobiales bacterium]
MTKTTQSTLLALVLTACSGPSAGSQAAPSGPQDLQRPHIYEIPSERMAAAAQEASERGWIQVDGSASVDVSPDRATVAFAVETRAQDAADAATQNAERMDAVLQAIRQANVQGLELESFGYSLRPEYQADPERRTREIVAYTALNNVRATTSDVNAVGRIIDTAIGAGANRVAGISFFASDTGDARNEAMAMAVRDARTEATVIARALGYELGVPMEVNGGAQTPRPLTFRGGMAVAMEAAQAAPTPVEAGDQTVTATVSIRFALGPEARD